VSTVSDKIVGHSLIYPCENDWWRTSPYPWKFGEYWPTPCTTL